MTKKLVKHGNSLALLIEKPFLKMLGIDEKTNLEISIEDNALIIKPINSKKTKTKREEIEEIAREIMKEYDPVFRRLSKT